MLQDGCPRVPEYPAAMVAAGTCLYVVTENRLEVYDTQSKSWRASPIELAERVGSGLVLLEGGEDKLFLLSGGSSRNVWEITPSLKRLRALPALGVPVGLGAAMAQWNGQLYLSQGGVTEDFWVLKPGAKEWLHAGRLGGNSPMYMHFGTGSGFLATIDDVIYAWPNHHIHRFDAAQQSWDHGPEAGIEKRSGNWVAMNFQPTFDGGGVATSPICKSIFAIEGMFSRSLNEIVPERKAAYFVRPRLPFPIAGEGDRLCLLELEGVPHLVVYAVEPANKLCAIPLSKLKRLTKADDHADEEPGWHRFHTNGGANGVRHWRMRNWRASPGPMDITDRMGGSLGVMGALDGELFTMRRAYTRRLDPGNDRFSFYPGFNLGRPLRLGAAGTYGEDRFLYFLTGGSDYFVRRKVSSAAPLQERPKPVLPVDKTRLEIMPTAPASVGRCASLAFLAGNVYALRGGATRDFWRFDPLAMKWQELAPLPAEAVPIGERGAGLATGINAVFAISGDQIWRFDLPAESWSRLGKLGFALDWDGGMVTSDGEGSAYVIRGGFSRRWGRFDLATGAFEELYPRIPDAVSCDGNRLAIITIDGELRLYLHRGHNSNEIVWIALPD